MTLLSIDDYLSTSYRPDCEYVEGELVERNAGTWNHGQTLAAVMTYLHVRRKPWNIHVLPILRIRVRATCIRVPDVCVYLDDPGERVPTKPPFLCIEILSPEDRMSRVEERIDDFLAMGVPYVWLLDPATRRAFTATAAEGLREVKSGILKTENPALEMPLSEIFE
jgi:Uma2 family endonuclease